MTLRDEVISTEDIRLFREEGAVVLKDFLAPEWLDLLKRGFDEVADKIPDTNITMKRDGRRNMMMQASHQHSALIAGFLRDSPVGYTSALAMGSEIARLYLDLLFVKEEGPNGPPTPWHQDAPLWAVTGKQMCAFWISLDETTRETGAMTMVPGSHLQPPYTPNDGSVAAIYKHLIEEEPGGPLPDPDAEPERFTVKCYETAPGDVVVFHPAMLHAAPGTAIGFSRRTFAFRFLGDDVRWQMRPIVSQDYIRALDLKDGDVPDAPCFPVVWPPERQTI